MSYRFFCLRVRVNMVLALAMMSSLSMGIAPLSSLATEELEMGAIVTPERIERGAEGSILAKFKKEYEAAQEESRPVFEKYLPLLGADALLSFLEETYPACHGQAHDLGKALFAAYKDLGAALRMCGARCTSGCMHGVVGEAFGSATLATLTQQMNTFCEEGEMARLHKPGNCAHALGHALMFVNDGNVKMSIDACLGFANEAMQYYCATGVYMEKLLTGPKLGASPPSLYYPCDQEMLFPTACYRYKANELLDNFGSPAQLIRECLRLGNAQRRGCFHGLGYAVKEAVFKDPAQLTTFCKQGTKNDKIVCIEGAIEKLAEYNEKRAKIACSFLSNALRPICLRAATEKMYSLTKPTFVLYYDKDSVMKRKTQMAHTHSAIDPLLPASKR